MFLTDSSRWLLIGDKKAKDCQVTVLYVGYPSWQSLLSNHYISYGWWFLVPMFNHDHDWHSLWASLVDCTARIPLDSPWAAEPRMRKPSSSCSMLRRIQIRCSAQHCSMIFKVASRRDEMVSHMRLGSRWCGTAVLLCFSGRFRDNPHDGYAMWIFIYIYMIYNMYLFVSVTVSVWMTSVKSWWVFNSALPE